MADATTTGEPESDDLASGTGLTSSAAGRGLVKESSMIDGRRPVAGPEVTYEVLRDRTRRKP